MELTEFLLERLTEDEDDARRRRAARSSVSVPAPAGAVADGSAGSPDRVLAACLSQRRVIDAYLRVTAESAATIAAGIPFVGVETLAAAESTMASMQLVTASTYERVLRWHAEVHAGHADYREEWRP